MIQPNYCNEGLYVELSYHDKIDKSDVFIWIIIIIKNYEN